MTIQVKKELQNRYDGYYDVAGKDQWRKIGADQKVKNILNLTSDYPHNTVLEIGSGEGAILKELSDQKFCKELFSLEISKSGIEKIKEKQITQLKEIQLFDGYNIPYEDKKFELVILTHVIEHVEFPRQLIYEASRVGRFVYIEVPLEDTIRLKENYIENPVGHINFFSMKTIKMFIASCNLKILKFRITNSSRSSYEYSFGRIGLLYYFITEFLLKISPGIASKIFTYNFSLIYE